MSKLSNKAFGHALAVITVVIWAVTFIATDYLLAFYNSLHLLLIRFVVAYAVLWLVKPRFMKFCGAKKELQFVLMSVTGVIGYYLFENYAIKTTGATTASILISFVPIVTLIMMCVAGRKKRLTFLHFIGFAAAITGVFLVVYNGAAVRITFNYSGVFAAFGSCVCWGFYSLLAGNSSKLNQIFVARRILFWTLLFVLPFTLIKYGMPVFSPLLSLNGVLCVIILGVFGSGLCYSMWNRSMHLLGVDITTNYLYVQPFITMLAAALLGTEKIKLMGIIGAVLIVSGVIISDKAKK